MASIYLITSKTSGKSYVGQTNSTAEKRWRKHLNEVSRRVGCRALYSAIKKYGVDDFSIVTLQTGDFTRSELNRLEQQYIQKQNTIAPHGYNLTTGGDHNEISEETRMLKSKVMKGRKITWGDKVKVSMKKLWKDPEYRSRMSVAHTGERGFKYKKHTKPLRSKLDIQKIQSMHKQGSSIYKIANEMGVSFGAIKRRINCTI